MNLTPWRDFLDFADRSLADYVDKLQKAILKKDPMAVVGCRSMQLPAPFGGHDIWRLSGIFGLFLPPGYGPCEEILDSFLQKI